ncbi:hypothetical protein F4782DRAFT_451160 [Xylaria castorea]|nr:hypothetical protein F4782DRAFT_451160 [Xylaria castorea]
MDRKWQEAPEVAEHSYPEVYHPVYIPEAASSHYHGDVSATQRNFPPPQNSTAAQRRVCGIPILILLLSTTIAALSITVIGLAVGTGLQTRRASNSESKLAALMSNLTMSTNSTTIDRGCSANPNAVTGTTYTSQFLGRPTFKIYCDANAPNPPLLSLFVGDFDDCIDACAFYSSYTPGNFPNVTSTTNTTCVGVSYLPDWTNRTTAMMNNAPGNCYLKPGPQTAGGLEQPQGGGVVHAAILSQSTKS